MYDILQTNKQKREVRQQHQAQAESTREQARTPSGEGSWLKVVLVGAGLALIGFSLGQLFQQSAPPLDQKGDQKSDQKVARTSPTPKLIPSPSPVAETTQVVDRSNPKMTIKAVVPKKPESFRESSAPKETPQNDREMQELKDLKKELQELKAMKDQLRDPGDLEDFEDEVRAAPGPEGGAVYGEPETITPAYPGEGAPRRGRSGVNVSPTPEIHY